MTGWLFLAWPSLAAATGQPYLTVASVSAAIVDAAPAVECVSDAEDRLVDVHLAVAADGSVSVEVLDGLPDSERDCVMAGLQAMRLPAHAEEQERLRFTQPIHRGEPLAPQSLTLAPRRMVPVLVRLPYNLSDADRRRAEVMLWGDVTEEPAALREGADELAPPPHEETAKPPAAAE